jgi:histidinol-phosphate/aromatic aminotransferase/cobyric acid decarboxylase-like protein
LGREPKPYSRQFCAGLNLEGRWLPSRPSGEYRRVCAQEQIEFVPFPLDRADLFGINIDRFCRTIANGSYGVVLLNNPHNPSGAVVGRHEVERVVEMTTRSGGTLLLD